MTAHVKQRHALLTKPSLCIRWAKVRGQILTDRSTLYFSQKTTLKGSGHYTPPRILMLSNWTMLSLHHAFGLWQPRFGKAVYILTQGDTFDLSRTSCAPFHAGHGSLEHHAGLLKLAGEMLNLHGRRWCELVGERHREQRGGAAHISCNILFKIRCFCVLFFWV